MLNGRRNELDCVFADTGAAGRYWRTNLDTISVLDNRGRARPASTIDRMGDDYFLPVVAIMAVPWPDGAGSCPRSSKIQVDNLLWPKYFCCECLGCAHRYVLTAIRLMYSVIYVAGVSIRSNTNNP